MIRVFMCSTPENQVYRYHKAHAQQSLDCHAWTSGPRRCAGLKIALKCTTAKEQHTGPNTHWT